MENDILTVLAGNIEEILKDRLSKIKPLIGKLQDSLASDMQEPLNGIAAQLECAISGKVKASKVISEVSDIAEISASESTGYFGDGSDVKAKEVNQRGQERVQRIIEKLTRNTNINFEYKITSETNMRRSPAVSDFDHGSVSYSPRVYLTLTAEEGFFKVADLELLRDACLEMAKTNVSEAKDAVNKFTESLSGVIENAFVESVDTKIKKEGRNGYKVELSLIASPQKGRAAVQSGLQEAFRVDLPSVSPQSIAVGEFGGKLAIKISFDFNSEEVLALPSDLPRAFTERIKAVGSQGAEVKR